MMIFTRRIYYELLAHTDPVRSTMLSYIFVHSFNLILTCHLLRDLLSETIVSLPTAKILYLLNSDWFEVAGSNVSIKTSNRSIGCCQPFLKDAS